MEKDSEVKIERDAEEVDKVIKLYQDCHLCQIENDSVQKETVIASALIAMESNGMSDFYERFCCTMKIQPNADRMQRMEAVRTTQLAEIEKTRLAEESSVDSPSDEDLLKRIQLHFLSGSKEEAFVVANDCIEKSIRDPFKVEVCFLCLRLGIFMKDDNIISDYLLKAKKILENYSNWEQRNRLHVYEGLYSVRCSKYSLAVNALLAAISTYCSAELMPYSSFLSFTVVLSLTILDRALLKKKILEQSAVTAILQQSPAVSSLLKSFQDCHYANIFDALGKVCDEFRRDAFFHASVDFIAQEVEIRAFNQYLEAYQSVHLSSMAAAFGLTQDTVESKLFLHISEGRVFCQIDKVGGHVIAQVSENMTSQYREILQKGEILQRQIQKLSKIVGV